MTPWRGRLLMAPAQGLAQIVLEPVGVNVECCVGDKIGMAAFTHAFCYAVQVQDGKKFWLAQNE